MEHDFLYIALDFGKRSLRAGFANTMNQNLLIFLGGSWWYCGEIIASDVKFYKFNYTIKFGFQNESLASKLRVIFRIDIFPIKFLLAQRFIPNDFTFGNNPGICVSHFLWQTFKIYHKDFFFEWDSQQSSVVGKFHWITDSWLNSLFRFVHDGSLKLVRPHDSAGQNFKYQA